jgi:hypothetical protein
MSVLPKILAIDDDEKRNSLLKEYHSKFGFDMLSANPTFNGHNLIDEISYKRLKPIEMKTSIISIIIILFSLHFFSCNNCGSKPSMKEIVNSTLDFSVRQSILMAESLKDKDSLLPKTTDRFGRLQTCKSSWWVSGFFPGVLWYL